MKFAITLDQRDHLRKKKYIPFLGLLKNGEIALLNNGIEEALTSYVKNGLLSPIFFGRDLWRRSSQVKRIVFSKRLSELAFELLQKKPLRLAYDQIFFEENVHAAKPSIRSVYKENISIQAQCCITNLLGLFFFCVKKSLSFNEGDGFFILSTATIPLELLEMTQGGRFFAIGYADSFSQYLHEPLDLEVHFLKSLGYVFGDKLNDKMHPILFR